MLPSFVRLKAAVALNDCSEVGTNDAIRGFVELREKLEKLQLQPQLKAEDLQEAVKEAVESSNPACAICMRAVNLLDEKDWVSACEEGHIYHSNCLSRWVDAEVKAFKLPRCPQCRDPISSRTRTKLRQMSADNDMLHTLESYFAQPTLESYFGQPQNPDEPVQPAGFPERRYGAAAVPDTADDARPVATGENAADWGDEYLQLHALLYAVTGACNVMVEQLQRHLERFGDEARLSDSYIDRDAFPEMVRSQSTRIAIDFSNAWRESRFFAEAMDYFENADAPEWMKRELSQLMSEMYLQFEGYIEESSSPSADGWAGEETVIERMFYYKRWAVDTFSGPPRMPRLDMPRFEVMLRAARDKWFGDWLGTPITAVPLADGIGPTHRFRTIFREAGAATLGVDSVTRARQYQSNYLRRKASRGHGS